MREIPSTALTNLGPPTRSITYGIVQPGKATDGGVPIVRVNNFRGHRLDLTERLCVALDVEAQYSRSRPRPNDILISLVGSIGQVAIAGPEISGWNLARAVGLIPTKDRHHALWIFYSLQSPDAQRYIRQHANTTVQATFNLKDLTRFPIPYPEFQEREQIIGVLGSLDEKIELNRRMNETLEAMAQAIFRDWFVDFGPTRRKMAGVTNPLEIMDGLVMDTERAQQLANLFPSNFGNDGLPEGWSLAPIRDFCLATENGGTPKRSQYKYWEPATVPWLTSSEVRNPIILGAATKISPLGLEESSAKVWPRYTTVIAMYGATAGQTALLAEPMSANQACCGLLPVAGKQHFLYSGVRENIDKLANLATGAAQQNLSQRTIAAFEIVRPDDAIMAEFGVFSSPFVEKRISNEREIETLAATRDLLLPKLMSGEIRIKDVEAIAEAAQ